MAVADDERAPRDTQIGERIRAIRQRQGMTLSALAEEIGISASAVSQIETGKIFPTMKRMLDIVAVLKVDLDDIFSSETTPAKERATAALVTVATATADSHPAITLEGGVEWRRLNPSAVPGFEFLLTSFPPGARVDGDVEFIRHAGWEVGYVVSGRLRVQVGFDSYELSPGDTISFPSTTPHKTSNPFAEPATAIWIELASPPA